MTTDTLSREIAEAPFNGSNSSLPVLAARIKAEHESVSTALKDSVRRSRFELAKQASAILKRAGCDAMTGANKDHHYRRNKRAERKRLARQWRAKRKNLGKFGAASPVRSIPRDGCQT